MSIRFNASGEGYSRALSGISPASFTFCGWSQTMSQRGTGVFQPILNAVRDLANHADMFTMWWDPDVDTYSVGSFKPTGGDFVGAAASTPAVNDQFFFYVRSGGLGLEAGWRRQGDAAWVTATSQIAPSAQFDTLRLNFDTFNNWSNRRQGAFYIYDSALSDVQLLAQMDQLAPIGSTWAWYPFNDPVVANNALDQSGNGRNLTPSGTLTVEADVPTAYPAATQTITGALFTNQQTFYGAALTASASIAGALFTNQQTFYGATLTPGAVEITGALFTNDQTFYDAVVFAGTAQIAGSLFTNDQVFYDATLSQQVQIIGGSLFTNQQTFYSAFVQDTSVYVTGVTAEGLIGTVLVWGQVPINPPAGGWTPVPEAPSGGWSQVPSGPTTSWTPVITS